MNEEIRIEADQEFEQSEIKRLNKKYNIVTYVQYKDSRWWSVFIGAENKRIKKKLLFKTKANREKTGKQNNSKNLTSSYKKPQIIKTKLNLQNWVWLPNRIKKYIGWRCMFRQITLSKIK